MRTLFSKLAFTAALMLAITFTFSCSGDSGGGSGNGDQSNISSGTEANVETSSSSNGTDKSSSSSEAEENSSSSVTETGNSSSSSISSTGSSSSSKGNESGLVKKDQISGVSQKGPFVKGSTAIIYELDEKLVQTGRSFRDIIADDKGSFDIKINVDLVSPYAMLETDGYYRNEVSGEVSTGTIKLYAIADIREKSNVNVNILTHLEYYRVQKLVEGGKSLQDAKKQAQKEILAVFGISGEFKNSEDMSIFGTTDGDAALLAISILLQGNLTEGQFVERLADFRLGFMETGAWDNKEAKKDMADWVLVVEQEYCTTLYDNSNCWPMSTEDMCQMGRLVNSCSNININILNSTKVRSNILGWKLSSSVPDFEKYVNIYWGSYYGFGACDAKKAGEMKDGPNGKKYICKNNAWVAANNVEKKCSENKSCLAFTDARDNQLYHSVKIGEQTWMVENLNYNAIGSKCYDNKPANCDLYGKLYNWETAMKACPVGWHLPSGDEWQELVDFAGGGKVAVKKLSATSWWEWDGKSGGTDDYGFSALPGGSSSGSNFQGVGYYSYWWAANEYNSDDAYYQYWFFNGETFYQKIGNGSLFSIRCVQD